MCFQSVQYILSQNSGENLIFFTACTLVILVVVVVLGGVTVLQVYFFIVQIVFRKGQTFLKIEFYFGISL